MDKPFCKADVPPVIFPVMSKVPALDLLIPWPELEDVPPRALPTMVPEVVPVWLTQAVAVLPAKILAVSVTPSASVNDPPAVAELMLSFRTSPVLPRFVDTLTVTVKEFATSTSPLAKVTAAAVPAGVVAQMLAAFMFPERRA
jgi:hypothetical protein